MLGAVNRAGMVSTNQTQRFIGGTQEESFGDTIEIRGASSGPSGFLAQMSQLAMERMTGK